jgi:heptosyltransferase III
MNILIIKLRHLGDVLITTPVVSALREAYPQSKITMVVNPGTEDMVRGHPDLEEVICLPRNPRPNFWEDLPSNLKLIKAIRRQYFDLSLDFTIGDRGAILSFLSGAPQRLGFTPKKGKQWWWKVAYTRTWPQPQPNKPIVASHLDLLRLLGLRPKKSELRFAWSPDDEAGLKTVLSRRGGSDQQPYVIVHPTSRWMFKTWRLDGYSRVIDHLQETWGVKVMVTSGPDDKEQAAVQAILAQCRTRPLDLSGRLTLKQLGCLIGGARLFFGVDSAPMHLAAAVKTPIIALFGPSGDIMWGPWGQGHRVLKKNWPCRPCGQDGCDGSKVSRCLVEITDEEVTAAVDVVLSSYKMNSEN